MVVYAVWDRAARVRFPAPRLSLKDYEISKEPTVRKGLRQGLSE